MNDTYYFSHDYNPRGDEKIQKLIFEMSWDGYGLFWALVELLYQNDGYMQYNCKRIAFELRTDEGKIIQLINDFDLFKIKDECIYSDSVLHRLKKRKGKTISARKAAKTRWDKVKQNDANAMQTHSEGNAIKESKVKESKVNKNYIEFAVFWDEYNKKVGDKKRCEKKWSKLDDEIQVKIIESLPEWKRQFKDMQFQPYPDTYLNQERWNDEIKRPENKKPPLAI